MRLQAVYKLMQLGKLSKYTSAHQPPPPPSYVKLTQWKNYMYTYVNGIEQPKKSAFQSQMFSIASTYQTIVITFYQIPHRHGDSPSKAPLWGTVCITSPITLPIALQQERRRLVRASITYTGLTGQVKKEGPWRQVEMSRGLALICPYLESLILSDPPEVLLYV